LEVQEERPWNVLKNSFGKTLYRFKKAYSDNPIPINFFRMFFMDFRNLIPEISFQ